MNKMSAGSGELFLSGENERGAVFTHRGRQRVRLSESLTQGGVIGGVCGMEWIIGVALLLVIRESYTSRLLVCFIITSSSEFLIFLPSEV